MDQPLATFCTREACGSGRLIDRHRLAGTDRKKIPRLSALRQAVTWVVAAVEFFGREYGVRVLGWYLQVGQPQVRGTGEKIGRSRAAAVPSESRPFSPAHHSLYPSFSLLFLSLSHSWDRRYHSSVKNILTGKLRLVQLISSPCFHSAAPSGCRSPATTPPCVPAHCPRRKFSSPCKKLHQPNREETGRKRRNGLSRRTSSHSNFLPCATRISSGVYMHIN